MGATWAAIVGTGNEGRTQAARMFIARMRAAGVPVGGALQERHEDEDGHNGWDVVDLETGNRRPLARRSESPELCEWSFLDSGFAAIDRALTTSTAEVVVLELGELETRKRGNWRLFSRLLADPASHGIVVACIRPASLAALAIDLPDPVAGLELPADPADLDSFVNAVISARAAG